MMERLGWSGMVRAGYSLTGRGWWWLRDDGEGGVITPLFFVFGFLVTSDYTPTTYLMQSDYTLATNVYVV